MTEVTRTVTLQNKNGLHARPISSIVDTVAQFDASLVVEHDGRSAEGSSVLEMMTLGAGPGVSLKLQASGPQAEELMTAVVELIEGKFGES